MIDYIKREDVREAMNNPLLMGLGFTEYELDRIPMADAERIVRCRECKFHHRIVRSGEMYCERSAVWHRVEENDFCSYGRKEDSDG